MANRIIREPLLHFLIIGLGLFLVYDHLANNESADDGHRIVVDRERLLTFMQYRSNVFQAGYFDEILDKLPEEELRAVIDQYVQEEALYREAKSLGLDKDDYVARRRLIQQLEFSARGVISTSTTLREAELVAWFNENKNSYYVAPKITFTHVFFSSDKHGHAQAEKLAQDKLRELNDKHVPFDAAMSRDDQFLYGINYIETEEDEITSHFGGSMREQLFAIKPSDSIWRGPYESPYGFHLVMVTKIMAGYIPSLEEVQQDVEQDALQSRLDAEQNKAIQSIVDTYEVNVVGELKRRSLRPDSVALPKTADGT